MRLLALAARCWQIALSAMLFVMSTEHPSRLLVGRVFIVIRLHVARVVEAVVCRNAKGRNFPPFFSFIIVLKLPLVYIVVWNFFHILGDILAFIVFCNNEFNHITLN